MSSRIFNSPHKPRRASSERLRPIEAKNLCHRANAAITRLAASASVPPTAFLAKSSARAVKTSFPLGSRSLTTRVDFPKFPCSIRSSNPRHSGHAVRGGSADVSAENINSRTLEGASTPTRKRCPMSGVASLVRFPAPEVAHALEASSASSSTHNSSIFFIENIPQFVSIKLLFDPYFVNFVLNAPCTICGREAQRQAWDKRNFFQSPNVFRGDSI